MICNERSRCDPNLHLLPYPSRKKTVKGGLLLHCIRVDPARGGERSKNLPFLLRGPVEIELRSPLTLLIGENGSGKTTLLEAVAANCAIRPGGGRSYAETDDEREDTAISDVVEVTFWRAPAKRTFSLRRPVCRIQGPGRTVADAGHR